MSINSISWDSNLFIAIIQWRSCACVCKLPAIVVKKHSEPPAAFASHPSLLRAWQMPPLSVPTHQKLLHLEAPAAGLQASALQNRNSQPFLGIIYQNPEDMLTTMSCRTHYQYKVEHFLKRVGNKNWPAEPCCPATTPRGATPSSSSTRLQRTPQKVINCNC